MTRRRTLKATLDASRTDVLCGRCGAVLAYVVEKSGASVAAPGVTNGWPRVLRFDAGWRRADRGVWVTPQRGRDRLAAGWPAWRRRPTRGGIPIDFEMMGGAEPMGMPVRAECPTCRAEQDLDPIALDVAPGAGPEATGWREVPTRSVYED